MSVPGAAENALARSDLGGCYCYSIIQGCKLGPMKKSEIIQEVLSFMCSLGV